MEPVMRKEDQLLKYILRFHLFVSILAWQKRSNRATPDLNTSSASGFSV